MILTVGICKIYTLLSKQFTIPYEVTLGIIIVVLLVLFISAFCKQTKHIVSRVEVKKKSQEEKRGAYEIA